MLSNIYQHTFNPANIKKSADNWLGNNGEYKGFVSFKDRIYGIRALIRLLRHYIANYNLHTVEAIISRFAPPKENDTERYIKFVKDFMADKFASAPYIHLWTDSFYCLAAAICKYETGFLLESYEYNYVLVRFELAKPTFF